MRIIAAVAALTLSLPAAAPAQAPMLEPPQPAPADVASIDAILTALYDVISGPADEPRDWGRFRSLFAPGARLIPTQVRPDGADIVSLTPDEYATRIGPRLEEIGFFESEVARRVEAFGAIAHVFSTYASYRTAEAQENGEWFTRGINSIQLLKDGDQWRVVTIFWDAEREGQPIPERYLGNGSP